jgi:hypothetical protein
VVSGLTRNFLAPYLGKVAQQVVQTFQQRSEARRPEERDLKTKTGIPYSAQFSKFLTY